MRPNPLKTDPSRTATLRRLFIEELRRRIRRIETAVKELLITDNALGLGEAEPVTFNENWRMLTSPQKLGAFHRWIKLQLGTHLVQATDVGQDGYWRQYIDRAYRQGLGRGFSEVRKAAALSKDRLSYFKGQQAEYLRTTLGRRPTVEALKFLAGRTFNDIEAVSNRTSAKLTRALADGMVRGSAPSTIAKNVSQILGVTRVEAERIARTEIVRAHAEGQLRAFADLGLERVGVLVEYLTAGDGRVCPQCSALGSRILALEEAQGLIPQHPNCRCCFTLAPEGAVKGRRRRRVRLTTQEL